MVLVLACLAAYLLGGIPFGLILVWALAGVDLRTVGSGNIGATNAARAFHTKGRRTAMFALIYLLDFAKGFLPTLLFPTMVSVSGGAGVAVAIGSCAVLGHCFSPYLGLKGGKGVATGCGIFAAVEPWSVLIAVLAFAVAYAVTRRVYFGSLTLGVALALAVILREPSTAFTLRASVTWLAVAVAVFFFYTHRSNLRQAYGDRA